MQPLDVVVLTTSVPGVAAGSVGTIVDYRTDGPTVLVEFDEDVVAVTRNDLRMWSACETTRAVVPPFATTR